MVALLVTSSDKGAGKTAVGAGLAQRLLADNQEIGFLKPVIAKGNSPPQSGTDNDAAFMKSLFALEETAELLSPVFRDESQLRSGIKAAYDKVAQGKDVVIIEGIAGKNRASLAIAERLDSRVIIVESYSKDIQLLTDNAKEFAKYLLGIVLNKVPDRRLPLARSELSATLGAAGVNFLGTLPEARVLLAPTVGELAEQIQGEILSGAGQLAELVENVMLGAMSIDSGLEYYGRKANKAVVIKSERPDMQMAALETSPRCLVLTGEGAPRPVVLNRAEEKNVPVILTKNDISAVANDIEDALSKTRFNQENKLPKLSEIMNRHFDFSIVYKELGLTG